MNIRYAVPAVGGIVRLALWKRRTKQPLDIQKNYHPSSNPLFVSAAAAAELLNSGDVLIVTGLGAVGMTRAMAQAVMGRCPELRGLTLLAIAGQGGRGKIVGTWDDLAECPGLLTKFFTGHLETFRKILTAADQGRIQVSLIPQGAFAQLIHGMSLGQAVFRTQAGIGTYVDPTFEGATGTIVANTDEQWVERVDDQLAYHCPWPNVGIFNVAEVDGVGNAYPDKNALRGEMLAAIAAIKARGGKVIIQCGRVVSRGVRPRETSFAFRATKDSIGQLTVQFTDSLDSYIPASFIDAIVVRPETSQALCWTHLDPNPAFIAGAKVNIAKALAEIKAINWIAQLTPKRGPKDYLIARAAAKIIAGVINPGAKINVGIGLPEEVASQLALAGLLDQLEMVVESGPMGGIATSGATFGCMINPTRIVESWQAFASIEAGLDVAILGALEIDERGNVNLSRKGPGVLGAVGTGGSTTIIHGAKTIVFVMRQRDGKTSRSRFVDQVQEVTFSAQQALAMGKQIFYVTDFGVLQLTDDSLELVWLMLNVSLLDLLDSLPIALNVSDELKTFDASVATGRNFKLV